MNGNGCDWYWTNKSECGKHDCDAGSVRRYEPDEEITGCQCDDEYCQRKRIFLSSIQCCACGGGDNVVGITLQIKIFSNNICYICDLIFIY